MRIIGKMPDWFAGSTAETVIGVISGIILFCIVAERVWERLGG